MAGSIGVSTIEVLSEIRRMKQMSTETTDDAKSAKVQKAMGLCAFVKTKLFFAAAHCLDDINEPEDEILYGTAGYLQTLLVVKQAMDKQV